MGTQSRPHYLCLVLFVTLLSQGFQHTFQYYGSAYLAVGCLFCHTCANKTLDGFEYVLLNGVVVVIYENKKTTRTFEHR